MAGLTNTISSIIAIPIIKKVHETSSSLQLKIPSETCILCWLFNTFEPQNHQKTNDKF
jgi:hypothetical protein